MSWGCGFLLFLLTIFTCFGAVTNNLGHAGGAKVGVGGSEPFVEAIRWAVKDFPMHVADVFSNIPKLPA